MGLFRKERPPLPKERRTKAPRSHPPKHPVRRRRVSVAGDANLLEGVRIVRQSPRAATTVAIWVVDKYILKRWTIGGNVHAIPCMINLLVSIPRQLAHLLNGVVNESKCEVHSTVAVIISTAYSDTVIFPKKSPSIVGSCTWPPFEHRISLGNRLLQMLCCSTIYTLQRRINPNGGQTRPPSIPLVSPFIPATFPNAKCIVQIVIIVALA
jgi:hypothetical protein